MKLCKSIPMKQGLHLTERELMMNRARYTMTGVMRQNDPNLCHKHKEDVIGSYHWIIWLTDTSDNHLVASQLTQHLNS